uniref:Ovule protein n=1 Tax=Panagrolaimus sp. ES5 TaxID=591445 RepID=A0AC34F8R3_9BILA
MNRCFFGWHKRDFCLHEHISLYLNHLICLSFFSFCAQAAFVKLYLLHSLSKFFKLVAFLFIVFTVHTKCGPKK